MTPFNKGNPNSSFLAKDVLLNYPFQILAILFAKLLEGLSFATNSEFQKQTKVDFRTTLKIPSGKNVKIPGEFLLNYEHI